MTSSGVRSTGFARLPYLADSRIEKFFDDGTAVRGRSACRKEHGGRSYDKTTAKAVLAALAALAGPGAANKWFEASRPKIASRAGVSDAAAKRYLALLVDIGAAEKRCRKHPTKPKWNQPNLWLLPEATTAVGSPGDPTLGSPGDRGVGSPGDPETAVEREEFSDLGASPPDPHSASRSREKNQLTPNDRAREISRTGSRANGTNPRAIAAERKKDEFLRKLIGEDA